MVQAVANGLLASSVTCLFALGLLPIVLTRRVFHIVHGLLFACAPYAILFVTNSCGANAFVIGVLFAVVVAVTLGLLVDGFIYRPLAKQEASTLNLFVASLGLYTIGTNSLSLVFGDESRSVRVWGLLESWRILGARLTLVHLLTILSAIIGVVAMWALFRFTKLGRQIRAIANDPELARVFGIDVNEVCLLAAAVGSALVACTGILAASDTNATPGMGMQPLMAGLVAVIIGGNRFWGTVLAAFILGMAQHLGVLWLPTQWQEAIVFVILIFVLLLKPSGLFGIQVKKATV